MPFDKTALANAIPVAAPAAGNKNAVKAAPAAAVAVINMLIFFRLPTYLKVPYPVVGKVAAGAREKSNWLLLLLFSPETYFCSNVISSILIGFSTSKASVVE